MILWVAGEGRLTMSDYRFSDGTVIPRGTQIAVAERAINQDKVNKKSFVFQLVFMMLIECL
jgi:hypothetical protein